MAYQSGINANPRGSRTAMNSELNDLQTRIIKRLQDQGPTTCERMSVELMAPQGNVRAALRQLHDSNELVEAHSFGFWDVIDGYKKKPLRQA